MGRRYRFKIEPKANWTWYKSNVVFSDWLKWEIRIQTIRCGGCGYWSRKRIFLNADCAKYRSAICLFELLDRKLHCNKLHFAILYIKGSLVTYSTCSTTQRSTSQNNTTQHNTTQHNTTQHNTAQHSTAQHSTAQLTQCSAVTDLKTKLGRATF